ncbi:MAG: hypothetical protein EXS37_12260 [Opitutus sp.]|nr:hypothetical protein [Opitutus sp.]
MKHKITAKKKSVTKSAAKSATKSTAKSAAKSAAKKPAPAPARSTAPRPSARSKGAKPSPIMGKPSKKTALRDRILKRKVASKPIAFSLDEVRAIAKTVTAKTVSPFPAKDGGKTAPKAPAAGTKKVKSQHFKAASIADILGFNPKKGKPNLPTSDEHVPEKHKRYFKLLIDLRAHLTEGIERHSEETLKRSAKDDTGDLSSYGQHMADAGTDTFDRDFALSMVASEQEALSEIDAAIKRIHAGTYGICEISQTPIAKERLLAVPFTRHSAAAQKNLERNRHRSRSQAGLFGELGEEGGGKMTDEDGGGE